MQYSQNSKLPTPALRTRCLQTTPPEKIYDEYFANGTCALESFWKQARVYKSLQTPLTNSKPYPDSSGPKEERHAAPELLSKFLARAFQKINSPAVLSISQPSELCSDGQQRPSSGSPTLSRWKEILYPPRHQHQKPLPFAHLADCTSVCLYKLSPLAVHQATSQADWGK